MGFPFQEESGEELEFGMNGNFELLLLQFCSGIFVMHQDVLVVCVYRILVFMNLCFNTGEQRRRTIIVPTSKLNRYEIAMEQQFILYQCQLCTLVNVTRKEKIGFT